MIRLYTILIKHGLDSETNNTPTTLGPLAVFVATPLGSRSSASNAVVKAFKQSFGSHWDWAASTKAWVLSIHTRTKQSFLMDFKIGLKKKPDDPHHPRIITSINQNKTLQARVLLTSHLAECVKKQRVSNTAGIMICIKTTSKGHLIA